MGEKLFIAIRHAHNTLNNIVRVQARVICSTRDLVSKWDLFVFPI